MENKEKYIAKNCYEIAKHGVKKVCSDYEKYLRPKAKAIKTIDEVMRKILFHAQNRQGGKGIKFKGREDILKEKLNNFNPKLILQNYKNSAEILNVIPDEWKYSNGKIRTDWQKYSNTIYETAVFLKDVDSADELRNVFNTALKLNKYCLPTMLQVIPGFGATLACDFLKEFGYTNFSKPDIHIKNIINELFFKDKYDISKHNIALLRKIDDICEYLNISQYEFDKILYLYCTHDFYLDEDKRNNNNKARNNERRNELIKKVKQSCNLK